MLLATKEDLLKYPVRICVSGSRSWHNVFHFEKILRDFLSWIEVDQKDVAFITGDAYRGPDRLIRDWCDHHNAPYLAMPADWDQFGKASGMIRNAEMRKVMTHLLTFWDGESPGTHEMVDASMADSSFIVSVIMVEPDRSYLERKKQFKMRNQHHGRAR